MIVRTIAILVLSTVPLGVAGQVYRCVDQGKTTYASIPCKAGATAHVVPSTSPTPSLSSKEIHLQSEANLGRVAIGMTPTQVELAWGAPKSRTSRTDLNGSMARWTYGANKSFTEVHFAAGRVTDIVKHASTGAQTGPVELATTSSSSNASASVDRAAKAAERRFVREGLSSAEIETLLGKPERAGWTDGLRWWMYSPAERDPQTRTTLWFERGRVVRVERKVEY